MKINTIGMGYASPVSGACSAEIGRRTTWVVSEEVSQTGLVYHSIGRRVANPSST